FDVGFENDFHVCDRSRALVRSEWQQGDDACALDCRGHRALMTCAASRNPARQTLAALRHEFPQPRRVLVVDVLHLVDAKPTDFTFGLAILVDALFELRSGWHALSLLKRHFFVGVASELVLRQVA